MRQRGWIVVLFLIVVGTLVIAKKGHDKKELVDGSGTGKRPVGTAAYSSSREAQGSPEEQQEQRKRAPRPEIKKRPKDEGYPVAKSVLGKEGHVFSPFNGNILDVEGIPPGTLMKDPTSDRSENAIFRVPPDENSVEGAEGK